MNVRYIITGFVFLATVSGCESDPAEETPSSPMSFFVTSATSTTGNLGGLTGADALCQRLATDVGAGDKTWRAYLSVERDASNNNQPTDARSRIGNGPWYNVNARIVAANLEELHARPGDHQVFLDERGERINGQWQGTLTPNQHDILTGSTAEGRVMPGMTCSDWTSSATTVAAQVGHSDGMAGGGNTVGSNKSWNSAHANQNCSNTAPRGGAGRIYCFAKT
jgi:hypothetical protein